MDYWLGKLVFQSLWSGDHFTKVQPATPGLSTGASGGAMISEAQSNQADISVHSTKLVSGSKHSSTDVAIHKTKQVQC